ncbi:transmembrane protein 126A [Salminus brasiliensis]|uniref:transmembrane protein 126A n=1 Tax=Salminus brasiliensis TaxID=930266 RepID=UPI003B82C9BE
MSLQDTGQTQLVPRNDVIKMISRKFEMLPEADRNVLMYGSLYLSANSALVGLIANSFCRRALNVTQARYTSSLPMAVLPFLTTAALYNGAVSNRLLSGDLDCPMCAITRGALVGLIGGGIYPFFLALPVNAGLATLYKSSPMPDRGNLRNLLNFTKNLAKPFANRVWALLVVQTLFGTYLSSKHVDLYHKMLRLPESEDLED